MIDLKKNSSFSGLYVYTVEKFLENKSILRNLSRIVTDGAKIKVEKKIKVLDFLWQLFPLLFTKEKSHLIIVKNYK